jgi:hypothetical protein
LPEKLLCGKMIHISKDAKREVILESFTIEFLHSNVISWFHENGAEAFALWSTSNGCRLSDRHRGWKQDVDVQTQ